MPVTPYVTTAEFTAHPTYLDLDDLRSGDTSSADQASELYNLLLMASDWADGLANQPLNAHQVTTSTRARVDRDGNLQLYPKAVPLLSVQSVTYGATSATVTTTADLTGLWVDEGFRVVLPMSGAPVRAGQWLFVRWTYTVGWVSTVLTAGAASGANALTVADPAGILPGQTYRVWEPGAEEFVTVSATYTPAIETAPPTVTSVPLAAPTAKAHAAGMGFSGMPSEMHLAIINYTVSQLMRPDTSAEDSYPDSRYASGTRQEDSRKDGSGLVDEAVRLLNKYVRVW